MAVSSKYEHKKKTTKTVTYYQKKGQQGKTQKCPVCGRTMKKG